MSNDLEDRVKLLERQVEFFHGQTLALQAFLWAIFDENGMISKPTAKVAIPRLNMQLSESISKKTKEAAEETLSFLLGM